MSDAVKEDAVKAASVKEIVELSFPWDGLDPFIMTVHHVDHYPEGTERLGPDPSLLAGRQMGADFSYQDGWSMYHGGVVPGFPQHPHRGFETVTVVRRGYVDHSDSLGATARYGEGDVQWLTTGSGIQHAEMFPLLEGDQSNELEMFQIWLNLPSQSKMVPAYFGMLWSETIPTITPAPGVEIDVMAGRIGDAVAPAPPPDSWAADPTNELGIWLIRLEPGSSWTIPTSDGTVNRMVHHVEGGVVFADEYPVGAKQGARLDGSVPVTLKAGDEWVEVLILQGRPIDEPVFQMGPFVMNSHDELRQAYTDYRTTQFGGWPWTGPDPVHAKTEGRFALHADGTVEHRKLSPK
jgi:hypothetical protein